MMKKRQEGMYPERLKKLKGFIETHRVPVRISFFVLGIASTVWFLIRVIPKPQRATYPCMQAAAPIMSAFITYLIGVTGAFFAFRKSRDLFAKAKFWAGIAMVCVMLVFGASILINDFKPANAEPIIAKADPANQPIGTPKGCYPGRVVWVHNADATTQTCSNTSGDYWFLDKNTNQSAINSMLSDGLKKMTEKTNCADAWDALFKYFNYNHSKGYKGYTPGEKIVIKVNLTTMGNGGRNLNDAMDATPQLALSLLEQLVDTLKITQSDITFGDPYRGFPNELWDKCHTKYPNVHYFEGLGTDGREQTVINPDVKFFTSDDAFQSRLPQAYVDAAYLINMPCLKSHGSAGISIAAKNHQGSMIGPDQDATSQGMGSYLHYDYAGDFRTNQVMGIYRHFVDFMASKYLGGNTLIYIVDAIWSGRDWFGAVEKWKMAPFNNDWTSSLFISQDAVAIESVGFDFLYNEYNMYNSSHSGVNFPMLVGVQDYIHQAADPNNWPAGIQYDPDHADHHAPVSSLGVHEHWNNMSDKKYSQNLGLNKGIELVTIPSGLVSDLKVNVTDITLPASLHINVETTITATIAPSNATNPNVIWVSSDPAIASIDKNGLVTPIKDGVAVISAIAVDGYKKASTNLTVDFELGIQQNKYKSCTLSPNPASTYAEINYNLNEAATIHVELLSLNGKVAATTSGIYQGAGYNTFTLQLNEFNLTNGLYICKVIANGKSTNIYTSRLIVRK
jgi:hypothetical protein